VLTQEQLRQALIDLLGGRIALRRQGVPCCEVLLRPEVRNIRIVRRLDDGTFESPANGVFETEDVIKVSYDITACLPVDVRMDLTPRDRGTPERFFRVNGLQRGPNCNPDPAQPNDPDASACQTDEVPLADSRIIVDGAQRMTLTVSIRDSCRRIAAASVEVVFVDVS
jgi:hypothetical protein